MECKLWDLGLGKQLNALSGAERATPVVARKGVVPQAIKIITA